MNKSQSAPLTPSEIEQWMVDAGWADPILRQTLNPSGLARACNVERNNNELSAQIRPELDRVRKHITGARGAAALLTRELKALDKAFDFKNAPLEGGSEKAFLDLLTTLAKAAPYLAPRRLSGGQAVPWAEFALRLDTHLRLAMDKHHTPATSDAPGVLFIVSAIQAVFIGNSDETDVETPGVNAEGIARLISRRRFRARSKE
jgi:hypothetical protein